jgi:hypothetical protein
MFCTATAQYCMTAYYHRDRVDQAATESLEVREWLATHMLHNLSYRPSRLPRYLLTVGTIGGCCDQCWRRV